MLLQDFLKSKPLYYKEIDHDRVHVAYSILKPHIMHPKTVHIVGTNGKGSTGRILAHLAHKSGLSVGHYSSPHILNFNERIWLDGKDVSNETLEFAHQKLYGILDNELSERLSYFEYTTLLALVVFQKCDLMVLEAGLGGEFDATNICDKELSIITPIGLDHQDFLGDTIEEIARTKIRSIQKKVLLSPQIFNEVIEIAHEITKQKNAQLFDSNTYIDIEDAREQIQIHFIDQTNDWSEYLIDNAVVAMQALEIMKIEYDVLDLITIELFGRFYALTDNIRIDVGHNPLAATAIEKALDKKVVLIYNSLEDKDYESVLKILKPRLKRVEIISIDSQRATTTDEIEKALKAVGLKYSTFKNIIDKDENYLVFGSFYVVEEFLKKMEINVPK